MSLDRMGEPRQTKTDAEKRADRTARIERAQQDRAVMWRALCRIAEGPSATGGDPMTVARDALNEVSA